VKVFKSGYGDQMRYIVRKIYYIINVIKLKLSRKRVIVSLTSEIKYPYLLDGNNKIGRKTYFNGKMEKCTYLGNNCRITADIGKYCSISNGVITVEGKHPLDRLSTSPVFYSVNKQCGMTYVTKNKFVEVDNGKRTIIENDVWIGENVIIKAGVKIGTGSIVAMGAVVTKNVEPYSIVAGVPARTIKKRFDEDIIDYLLETKWWEQSDLWIKNNLKIFENKVSYNIKEKLKI